ncbi:MAG TPA: triose-phosphate isomerase family protein [Patescibacteria group bacterium]|nr:triose-phosphate isomerase family protein [Patescibacteria group bacterium]
MNAPFLVANWKCNKTIDESLEWIQTFQREAPRKKGEVIVCPPLPSLSILRREILANNWNLSLGAQNISCFEGGAYTGEVSGIMLKDLVEYVIIGHSERRRWFRESDKEITDKIRIALKNDIIPLVCVSNNSEIGLWRSIPESSGRTLLVGFEPIEAIGTGASESPEYVDDVAKAIKTLLSSWKDVYVLYGGSVHGENVQSFIRQKNIDGVLVGSASLHPTSFKEIVENASK